MNKSNVAIVVPVYNVEKYLNCCLDSLNIQTDKRFTVFAVDDGSSDSSGQILDNLACKYPWLQVYHKANGGVSSARNYALDRIDPEKYKYIAFVDPDDFVTPNFIYDFLKAADDNNVDCVVCGVVSFDRRGDVNNAMNTESDRKIGIQEVSDMFFGQGYWKRENIFSARFLSNKCYLLDRVREIRFNENMRAGEDQDYFIRALSCVRTGFLVSRANYRYRLRKTSLTRTITCDEYNIKLYLQILKENELTDKSRMGVILSLFDSWWQELKQSYVNRDEKGVIFCKEIFNEVYKYYRDIKTDFKYTKRFMIYKLGDGVCRLYFCLRKNKNIDYKKNYFE